MHQSKAKSRNFDLDFQLENDGVRGIIAALQRKLLPYRIDAHPLSVETDRL
jgi:hypothetical protein